MSTRLSIGGSDYIGYTSQDPHKRLNQHLASAKDEDSQLKVHIELRRFGFIHEFEVMSEHENEILGLVAEITNIKRYNPELNSSIGGEGNNFNVFEMREPKTGELIFFVEKKKATQDS